MSLRLQLQHLPCLPRRLSSVGMAGAGCAPDAPPQQHGDTGQAAIWQGTHIVGVPLEPNREVLQAAIGCAGGEGNDDGLQQCRAQAQRWHRRPAKGPPISLQLGRSNACCHASRTPTGRTTPVFRRTVQAGRSSMGSGRSMSM